METAYRNAWNAFVASIEAESSAGSTLAKSPAETRERERSLNRQARLRLVELLRLTADEAMGSPSVFRLLCAAEHTLRLAAEHGSEAAEENACKFLSDPFAVDSDEDEDEPTVEDRLLSGDADRRVVADAIAGAHQGERFRVTAAAAEILADLVRREAVRLSSSDLSAIREAIRLDYASPI